MTHLSVSTRAGTDPRRGWVHTAAALAAAAVALAGSAGFAEPARKAPESSESRELRASGMTFVGSNGEASELVLRSRLATFFPDSDLADLAEVTAVLSDDRDGESFKLTCDRAELHVDTNDFRAEGNVRGTTSDGQRYSAPWVGYDHEAGLLFTDAPVRMVDGTGTFRGDGFRYSVVDRTFRLLGNVLVEQNP